MLLKNKFNSKGWLCHPFLCGNKIILDCSKRVKTDSLSNTFRAAEKMQKGKDIAPAEYTIKEQNKCVRVEVMEGNGKYARSNIIKI